MSLTTLSLRTRLIHPSIGLEWSVFKDVDVISAGLDIICFEYRANGRSTRTTFTMSGGMSIPWRATPVYVEALADEEHFIAGNSDIYLQEKLRLQFADGSSFLQRADLCTRAVQN